MQAQTHRRAFSLIEIMVVVMIIVVLLALLVPALGLLKRNKNKHATAELFNNLELALASYYTDNGAMGSDPDAQDFRSEPLRFLSDDPKAAGKEPYLDVQARFRQDSLLLDGFGDELRWLVEMSPDEPTLPKRFQIVSAMGTHQDDSDDLILELDVKRGRWQIKTGPSLPDDTGSSTP